MIKVATPDEMRKLRAEHSLKAQKMTQEEAHAQMRRNGSIPSPNPYYRGSAVKKDSASETNSQG